MNWVQRFRESMGMSRTQFARAITRQLGGRGKGALSVPGALIGILEDMNGAVTHPRLADMIAAACGATKRQRDGIVAKQHRGTWLGVDGPQLVRPEPRPKPPKKAEPVTEKSPNRFRHNTRRVVVLDRAGNEIRRFDTLIEAAAFMHMSAPSVSCRCRHMSPFEWSTGNSFTARYAEEWDTMTPTQKRMEMRRTVEYGMGKAYTDRNNVKKPVVMVDRQARELGRWPSIADAEKETHICDTSIQGRCARNVKREYTRKGFESFTFRFASEWDTMNEEQRRMDVGAV